MRGLTVVLLLAATVLIPAQASGSDGPPNVLVILTDDQRPGTMSVMPETRFWFNQWGVRYARPYVTTPLCCPARASILSGRYAHNHGVTTNDSADALDFGTTLPRLLGDAGYTTAYTGKFLNGYEGHPPYFDRWSIYASFPIEAGYMGSTFDEDGVPKEVDTYTTNYIREWAVDFVEASEAQDGRPWFLMVAPIAPHLPAIPAKRFEDAPVGKWHPSPAVLEEDTSDKPPHVSGSSVNLEAMRKVRRKQLRTLMSVDLLVAKLMKVLGTLGERGNTLAFYTSDNGFLWGEHGVRGKRYPYTPSVGVPMFARWPGHLNPGTVDARFVANIDIPATILDAAGVAPAAPLDGRSLLDPWQRDHLFLEYFLDSGADVPAWRSVVTSDVQFIEHLVDGQVAFREYYDMASNPWQLTNLLGDPDASNDPPAQEIAELSAQAEHEAACSGTSGPEGCP